MQSLTRYGFSNVICGFFEFSTHDARQLLPTGIEPVEVLHGRAVFSMTVFDFTHSEVGPYREVVMAVVVAPLLRRGEKMPKAAFYPYLVGTTSRETRNHGIERWHLPHWMSDVQIHMEAHGDHLTATIAADDAPVAELTVRARSWEPVTHMYQSFMNDSTGLYQARVKMEGELSEHEEESGRLTLHDHPFNRRLDVADIYEQPFREQWMRGGMQTFEPLQEIRSANDSADAARS